MHEGTLVADLQREHTVGCVPGTFADVRKTLQPYVGQLAGSELDVPAMIGLVMLMGIVTKNSILLVEYAVVGITGRGLSVHDALIDACHKRARPIVMTTVAMIAGMLPIALGLGADASFRQPMAIAVIGGLVSSTALSLLVVPVAFTYLDTLARRIARGFKDLTARGMETRSVQPRAET